MATRYSVTHDEAGTFTRTSEHAYTHAALHLSRHGDWAATWHGSEDAAKRSTYFTNWSKPYRRPPVAILPVITNA